MKRVFVKRSEMESTARKLAKELGGKMVSMRGVNSAGKANGIAIVPANVRGGQVATQQAMAIVCEE